MDTNEKRPRRPRIGENKGMTEANENPNIESTDYASASTEPAEPEGEQHQYSRPYAPRQGYGNRQGGYNNRQGYGNRGYNNNFQNRQQGGFGGNRYNKYQQRPYNNFNRKAPNPDAATDTTSMADDAVAKQPETGGYQPRQYNNYNNRGYNNRQGGYNNYNNRGYNNRQGGYNNYNNRGYNNRGFGNPEGEGEENGYQQRPYGGNRQGGYNNNRQGGYNNRQGGYNNRQNGYNNRQGGYNSRQGGYNNRQGGYGNNRQGGFNNQMPRQGKSFTPRPKRIEYEMPIPDPNEQIRLNKFMANAGICSRREADEFIQQGLVKVNGQVVTELGTKISHADTVEYDEKVVTLENKCYILLNKPKDCVTTSDDPNGRLTVLDLVKGACEERIYPVGRLDRNTTGVLLLTNDGDLASKLTHPKYVKKKIYHVWTDKDISEDDMQRIADGIELDDGPIHADAISYATETDKNQAGIEIHSGRNRIVRRIFESLGYHVTKLDRVYFAGLTKKNLPRGRWRYLTQEEVNYLKMGSFE